MQNQFCVNDFLRTIANAVHNSDPCKLILHFQLLIDSLFLCHLCYKQVELIVSLSVNICKTVEQLAAENQIGVDERTMLSEVLRMLPALDANGVDFFLRDDQTRDVVISM